jgi:hypothetical protein
MTIQEPEQSKESFIHHLQRVLALTEHIFETLEENSRLNGASHLPSIEKLFLTRENHIKALQKMAEDGDLQNASLTEKTLLQSIHYINEKIAFSLEGQSGILDNQLRKLKSSKKVMTSYHSHIEYALPELHGSGTSETV